MTTFQSQMEKNEEYNHVQVENSKEEEMKECQSLACNLPRNITCLALLGTCGSQTGHPFSSLRLGTGCPTSISFRFYPLYLDAKSFLFPVQTW